MTKRFLVRVLLCFLIIGMIGSFFSYAIRRKRVMDAGKAVAKEEAAWLLTLQLANGSFSCYELQEGMSIRVNPYFSSYAALAILKSDDENIKKENVAAYLDWYFYHMNMSEDVHGSVGTVYDYEANVQDGEVISEVCTYSYDSADSYAAVFLMLLWEYFEQYGNAAVFYEEKHKMDALIELLLDLQSKGYAESFRGSGVKYLMDNVEVYRGMQSALELYENLWEKDEMIPKLKSAIFEFEDNFEDIWWNGNGYYSALDRNNQPFPGQTQEWGRLYEYALPQLFPAMFGVNKPISFRSVQLYSSFCEQWDWQNMEYLEQTGGNQTWSLIAYAAVVMGDYGRIEEYLRNFKQKAGQRSYPYYSGDSAWIVLAFS